MKSIHGEERAMIITGFWDKLEKDGMTIADFARRNGIKLPVFYARLYDRERGLYGKVRDTILDYLLEK